MDRSEAGKRGYQKTKDRLDLHRQQQKRRAREAYEADPKICPQCGKILPYAKRHSKFCDQSCAASYNNQGVTRHIRRSRFCSCGKPKKLQNKYCKACANERLYNRVTELADAKSDRIRRRILLQNRGHQCEVCGFAEWMNQPIPLELDHIDGDADNNTEANLRLICPNCHAQTDNYKGANMGTESSRQKKRRQRYATGKTY